MLIYHPMLDPYHCCLRMLSVLCDSEVPTLEWDRIRLIDFFVTFPHLLGTIRFPNELRRYRKQMTSIPEPFEMLPSAPRLFYQMGELQSVAAGLLTARGYVDAVDDGHSLKTVDVVACKSMLAEMGKGSGFRTADWYGFLVDELTKLPLHGPNGLKARSGLLEYRHDTD